MCITALGDAESAARNEAASRLSNFRALGVASWLTYFGVFRVFRGPTLFMRFNLLGKKPLATGMIADTLILGLLTLPRRR